MENNFDANRLFEYLAEGEPEELRASYLVVPQPNRPYAMGAMVPLIGQTQGYEKRQSGLLVPSSGYADRILAQGATYVTVAEYLDFGTQSEFGSDMLAFLRGLLDQTPRGDLLVNLAVLNRYAHRPDELAQLQRRFIEVLPSAVGARLRAVVTSEPGRWRFLTRQPILMAMRHVLSHPEPEHPELRLPPLFLAILVVHTVGSLMSGAARKGIEGRFAGLNEELGMEFVSNSIFNKMDDEFASMDRHLRLWREYGARLARYPGPKPPAERIRDITGLEVEDLLGMAFAAWAHVNSWTGEGGYGMGPSYFGKVDEGIVTRYLDLCATTLDGLALIARSPQASPWDFLAFEKFPILRLGENSFVLDESYLIERVTSGLYYDVFDYEKDRGAKTLPWTQTFSEMVELMAEDSISQLVPARAMGRDARLFTEEDLGRAYGHAVSKCDAAVWAPPEIVLFEVVSGAITFASRVGRGMEEFAKDTEKLVLKKAKQLSSTAHAILGAPEKLLGNGDHRLLRVIPVVVVFRSYPMNPITERYALDLVRDAGLFEDARISRLAVIDFTELEMIEGLVERGSGVVPVLRGWQSEDMGESLRNYVLRAFGGGPDVRPSRMAPYVHTFVEHVVERLNLRSENGPDRTEWKGR